MRNHYLYSELDDMYREEIKFAVQFDGNPLETMKALKEIFKLSGREATIVAMVVFPNWNGRNWS